MNKGHEIKVLDHGFVRYIDHMGDQKFKNMQKQLKLFL